MFSKEYTCSGHVQPDTETYEGPREEEGSVVGDYRTQECEENGGVEGEEEYWSSSKPLWEYVLVIVGKRKKNMINIVIRSEV